MPTSSLDDETALSFVDITPSGIEILAKAYQRVLTTADMVEGGLDSYTADQLTRIRLLEKRTSRIPFVGRDSWTITGRGREYFSAVLEYAKRSELPKWHFI